MNSKLFFDSLHYVEAIHNKVFEKVFGREDFEQLNSFYNSEGLKINLDLNDLFKKIEELTTYISQEKVDAVEKESAKLINSYTVHYQSIFFLDGFPYTSIAEALKHALTVFIIAKDKSIDEHFISTYPKLEKILSSSEVSDNRINDWYFNDNFFTIDHEIFKALGCNLNVIRTSDKSFCVKSLKFLDEVSVYNLGEGVNEIESRWIPTRKGKDRWMGSWKRTIVEGNKGESNHNFQWVSDKEVIYQNTYGIGLSGGSQTKLFNKNLDDGWKEVKTLQRLIR